MAKRRNRLQRIAASGLAAISRAAMTAATSFFDSGASTWGGYAGGRRDNRRVRSWRPPAGSADSDINPDLADLRARSRDLTRNSPMVAGAIKTKTNGVIGTGLKFKSELDATVLGIEAEDALQLEDKIEAEFALFARECDFAGVRHLLALQRLIYRSMIENGDVGIARRYRREAGQTYGTKIVLIEADRVGNPGHAADSQVLRGGVHILDGEVRGYHVADRHPGDLRGGGPVKWGYVPRLGPSGLVQFVLPFEQLRVGQARGVPDVAPLLTTIKQLTDYSEAEVSGALNAAMLFAFEKLTAADEADGQGIVPPAGTGAAANASQGEVQIEDMAIIALSPGSDVEINAPGRPNPQYEAFVSAVLQFIGAALQIPHELLTMRFQSSYSASRAAMELAWKAWQAERSGLVLGAFDPILEWFFVEMISLGRFEAPGFFEDPVKRAAWMGHQWVAPVRIQIDPVKEATADEIDVGEGFKTIEQVIVERTGGDFERKHRQRAHEHKSRTEAGLAEDARARAAARNARPAPQRDEDAEQRA